MRTGRYLTRDGSKAVVAVNWNEHGFDFDSPLVGYVVEDNDERVKIHWRPDGKIFQTMERSKDLVTRIGDNFLVTEDSSDSEILTIDEKTLEHIVALAAEYKEATLAGVINKALELAVEKVEEDKWLTRIQLEDPDEKTEYVETYLFSWWDGLSETHTLIFDSQEEAEFCYEYGLLKRFGRAMITKSMGEIVK